MKRREQAGKTLQTLNAAGDGGQGISIALPIQSFDPTLQEIWREEETLRWGKQNASRRSVWSDENYPSYGWMCN